VTTIERFRDLPADLVELFAEVAELWRRVYERHSIEPRDVVALVPAERMVRHGLDHANVLGIDLVPDPWVLVVCLVRREALEIRAPTTNAHDGDPLADDGSSDYLQVPDDPDDGSN
jgi:hypothetical protein